MVLNPGEIHIWSAAIDEEYEKLLGKNYLSVIEKKRAKKFTYDIDSFVFTVRHNLLRIILGRYLHCNPAEIRFNNNRYQKPHIAHPNTTLQFNISISSNRFVAAFCLNHIVGVDIELIRHVEDIKLLITDYFTIQEAAWVYTHPEEMLETVFLNLWSKKEAITKAIGKGLNIELSTFDVISENPVRFGGSKWFITPLTLFDDCIAALATNNPSPELFFFNASEVL